MRSVGRAIGLDVHRDFCEVAIAEAGEVRSSGRVDATPEQVELFAASLHPRDRVALEVSGSAWEVARILERHVARVVVVSPADTGIRQAILGVTGSWRVASHAFAIIENAHKMPTTLDQERRALQARWAEREQQLQSAVGELAEIYGDLRGLGTALPTIEHVELPQPETH